MTRFFLVAGLLPLFLFGGADAPAQEPPGSTSIAPGQWEVVTEMTSIDAPGLPEAALQLMRTQLASSRESRSQCITPEQASDPAHNVMGIENSVGCEFSETRWSGSAVRIRGICAPPGGPRMRLSIDGSYVADQVNGQVNWTVELPDPAGTGPDQRLHMQGRLTGRRTGDCVGAGIEPSRE